MNEAVDNNLVGRLEWDYEDIDKASWGDGEWLNEPDKVQCIKEGYPCLILRAYHGALCGYIGVGPDHPAYGLSNDGIPGLIAEIHRAEFREKLSEWGKAGMPKTKDGLPDIISTDIEEPEPTDVGKAILDIRVHGGLTWGDTGSGYSKAVWIDFVKGFDKAREQALIYPRGDSARWLKKWAKAEHSYEEFRHIVERTCMCFSPLPEDYTSVWFFGFDCAHALDLCPAIDALTRRFRTEFEPLPSKEFRDVYRNLAYVEDQCLQLAIQLKAIEGLRHDQNS